MITTTQAAKELGVTRQRVYKLIETGQLQANRFNDTWAIERESLDHYLLIKQAQGAWAILGITPRLWGRSDFTHNLEQYRCPGCGKRAFSPGGETKYSSLRACPSCGWIMPQPQ